MPEDSLGYAIARMENEPVLRDGVEVIRAGMSITFEYEGEEYGHAICVEADEFGSIPEDLENAMVDALVDAFYAWQDENTV